MKRYYRQKGFSLMELAIIVAITAILSVVAVATYMRLEKAAHLAVENSTAAAINSGLYAYFVAHYSYPEQLDDASTGAAGEGSGLFNKVLIPTPETSRDWKKTSITSYLNTATLHGFCYDSTEGTFGTCGVISNQPLNFDAGIPLESIQLTLDDSAVFKMQYEMADDSGTGSYTITVTASTDTRTLSIGIEPHNISDGLIVSPGMEIMWNNEISGEGILTPGPITSAIVTNNNRQITLTTTHQDGSTQQVTSSLPTDSTPTNTATLLPIDGTPYTVEHLSASSTDGNTTSSLW